MAVLKDSNLPLGDQKQYTFSRKTWLDNQSKHLWKIERGIVRTSVLTEAGNIITTGYWGVGDVVGYPLSEAQTCAIECVTSVEAWKLGSEQWPLYVTNLLRYGQQLESFAVIGRLERTDLRLQQFLIWMAQKFGRVINLGCLIEVPLTRQAIAEAIGTTRVTVTRLLGQFRQEGILIPQKRHLVLSSRLLRTIVPTFS
jgi:CRP-like cAMP-binding protein